MDVICACDTATSIERYLDSEANAIMYMISDQWPTSAGQGTNNITLRVDVGDVIYFTTQSINGTDTVSVYNINNPDNSIMNVEQISPEKIKGTCIAWGEVNLNMRLTTNLGPSNPLWFPIINLTNG